MTSRTSILKEYSKETNFTESCFTLLLIFEVINLFILNTHKIYIPIFLSLTIFLSMNVSAQKPFLHKAVQLPNGWSLSPAGTAINLTSDLPLNIALSPNGKYLAVTDNGDGREGIDLINLKKKKLLSFNQIPAAYIGLQFTNDGKYLYASMGEKNIILQFKVKKNKLIISDSIVLGKPWPNKIGITGLALNADNSLLFAVTRENNSLYVCDTKTNKIIKQIPLSAEAYTCLLNPQKNQLFISLWGGDKVDVYDLNKEMITDSFATESHPNDMALTKDGKFLFVANANSNSVSVIDLDKHKTIETLSASLYPDAPAGSTTNSVCSFC